MGPAEAAWRHWTEWASLTSFLEEHLKEPSSRSRRAIHRLPGVTLPSWIYLRTTPQGIETHISGLQCANARERKRQTFLVRACSGWTSIDLNHLLRLCYRLLLFGQDTVIIYTGYSKDG
jgi:hypothetical protein